MNEVEKTMLAEARAEVGYADNKAALILASLGIGFGALAGGLFSSAWRPTSLESPWEAVFWLGAISAGVAVLSAAQAVWPRTHIDPDETCIYYWGHVARYGSVAALTEGLKEATPGEEDRTRHQLWELSRIVAKKYRYVRRALALAGVAVAALAVAGLSSI